MTRSAWVDAASAWEAAASAWEAVPTLSSIALRGFVLAGGNGVKYEEELIGRWCGRLWRLRAALVIRALKACFLHVSIGRRSSVSLSATPECFTPIKSPAKVLVRAALSVGLVGKREHVESWVQSTPCRSWLWLFCLRIVACSTLVARAPVSRWWFDVMLS